MKKAIVTGATGFVGAAVCRALSDREYEITALVRDEASDISTIETISNLEVIYLPMSEYRNMSSIVKHDNVDCFFHFAWTGSAGSIRGDNEVQIKNIEYTCDAVKEAAKLNCRKFVYAGSIMEYEVMAAMEKGQPMAINTLYSTAKLTADYMAAAIAADNNIEYIRAIISNIYGPGEMSPRFINTTIRKMLKGEHCSFSSGEQKYDFIYITDAARAFVDLAEKGQPGKAYYIGNSKQKQLKGFIKEIRDAIDPETELGLGELQSSGIALTYREFDTAVLERDIGFMPEVSFTDGIKVTRDWISKNMA